jgi:hypothetical protein
MSFILDALKKSETERQQQSPAEFSSVPASSGNSSPTRWLWMLGLLLLVNFGVLIGILMKPTATEEAVPLIVEPAPAQAGDNSFEEQVAVAMDNRVVPEAVETTVTTTPPAQPRTSNTSMAVVPTIDQLRLEGSLQIAELHLDIHVFSEIPSERFVFINMNKHREGSRTAEGPVVREIRTDGVVLEHQGRVFLLPRE